MLGHPRAKVGPRWDGLSLYPPQSITSWGEGIFFVSHLFEAKISLSLELEWPCLRAESTPSYLQKGFISCQQRFLKLVTADGA